MASLPVRDPVADQLLTPQNSALAMVDYQPSQFAGVRSMDRDLLLDNIVSTVRTAKAFDMPIVHSTINVATGRGQPTVPELAQLLENTPPIDRTTTNAWEDAEFLAAERHGAAPAIDGDHPASARRQRGAVSRQPTPRREKN